MFTVGELQVFQRQFTVRLALAAAVHKRQSKTPDRAVVDLRKDFLGAGMLYVALSREGKEEDILLLRRRMADEEESEAHSLMNSIVRNPLLIESLEFSNNTGFIPGNQLLDEYILLWLYRKGKLLALHIRFSKQVFC